MKCKVYFVRSHNHLCYICIHFINLLAHFNDPTVGQIHFLKEQIFHVVLNNRRHDYKRIIKTLFKIVLG